MSENKDNHKSLPNMDYHGDYNPTKCFLLTDIILTLILNKLLPGFLTRWSAITRSLLSNSWRGAKAVVWFSWSFWMAAMLHPVWLTSWGQTLATNGQSTVTELQYHMISKCFLSWGIEVNTCNCSNSTMKSYLFRLPNDLIECFSGPMMSRYASAEI